MLLPNKRLATLLLCAATTGIAVPTAAEAKATKAVSAATILKDCKKDGVIGKRYRLADLKKAQKTAKKSKSKYGACAPAIASAIGGLSGKKGTASTNAIVKQCSTGTGALTKKYKLSTLKKALKELPADVKNYGDGLCGDVITSQINTIK